MNFLSLFRLRLSILRSVDIVGSRKITIFIRTNQALYSGFAGVWTQFRVQKE